MLAQWVVLLGRKKNTNNKLKQNVYIKQEKNNRQILLEINLHLFSKNHLIFV